MPRMSKSASRGGAGLAAILSTFVLALPAAAQTPPAPSGTEQPPAPAEPAPPPPSPPPTPEPTPNANAPAGAHAGASAHAAAKPAELPEFDDKVEAPRAIFLSADFGATRPDLGLGGDLGFDKTAANGVLYGVAAGYRLRAWRFGLRWRVQDTTEFTLWSFAASAGYAFPLRPLTPIVSFHLGYTFDQGFEPPVTRSALAQGAVLPPVVDVKGLVGGIDLAASYWVTAWGRLGIFVGADAMFLSRATATMPRSIFGATPEVANHPLYTGSDTSLGLNLNAGIRGAFDIGLK